MRQTLGSGLRFMRIFLPAATIRIRRRTHNRTELAEAVPGRPSDGRRHPFVDQPSVYGSDIPRRPTSQP